MIMRSTFEEVGDIDALASEVEVDSARRRPSTRGSRSIPA
jgi:hypothetical protein